MNLLLLMLMGVMFVLLWVRQSELRRRLDQLEARIWLFGERETPPPETVERTLAGSRTTGVQVQPPAEPGNATPAAVLTIAASAQATAPVHTPPYHFAPTSGLLDQGLQWLKRWLSEGNVPVKIGVLVSFVGVAALLRYATEQGWLSAPIELRLLGVVMVALAALGFAWRQRRRRRVFSLALQGGAMGVLLLTVFAAFQHYALIPAPVAFALLLVLVASTAWLAALQNALALAVLALVAGFAAPILVSTGEGNHVVLFSYYAVLNLGLFALALLKSWPLLSRLGFVFTFMIGTAWGVLVYAPAQYATIQPFLIVFFGLYLLIPVIQALRAGDGRQMDVLLVFGLPLLVFPLQAALLRGEHWAIALSALVLATIYAASSALLIRRWGLRPLGDTHAVLAVAFATLAVPYAFSGATIAIIWALEGAALIWFGMLRQQRWTRLAGLALQAAAAVVWLITLLLSSADGLAVLNGIYLGGLALVVAAAISARYYAAAGAAPWRFNALALWALMAWLLAGGFEIGHYVPYTHRADALLILAAVTAALTALAHARHAWTVTGVAPGLLLLSGIGIALVDFHARHWPLAGAGVVAWPLFVLLAWYAQRWLAGADPCWRGLSAVAAHAAVAAGAAAMLVHVAEVRLQLGEGWCWLAGALPLLLLGAVLKSGRRPPLTPRALPPAQQAWLRNSVSWALVLVLLVSVGVAGEAAPLAFLPILNPLEILQLAILALLVRAGLHSTDLVSRRQLGVSLAALAFIVVSVMVLRGVHHLAAVPWSAETLLASRVSQAALSVCWTAIGVAAWVTGSRSARRGLWLAGALLLGVVLLKLLVVDRQFLSTVAGIVSFLAFGLLAIVVGFLVPAPPSATRTSEASARS